MAREERAAGRAGAARARRCERRRRRGRARACAWRADGARGGHRARSRGRADRAVAARPTGTPLRLAIDWDRRSGEHLVGLGLRHGTAARSGRARRPARRRPPLHRPRLPARDARRGRHPPGRLRAAAVAAVEPRLRRLVPDRRQRHPLRPGRRADLGLDPGRRRAAAGWSCCAPDAGGAAARPVPADRVSGAAAGVGLRLLEEPRRARAPGRRARRLRGLSPLADPARRDRDRLAVGDAIQHLGVQPPPVPGRRRDGRAAARGRACGRSCG